MYPIVSKVFKALQNKNINNILLLDESFRHYSGKEKQYLWVRPRDSHYSVLAHKLAGKGLFDSAERFPLVIAAMSVAMSIVWAMMFTSGDDDLFWTWVILLPLYLILLCHNFLLRDGMIKKSIPFTASYAIACIIWIIFLYIHGDPWFWSSGLFTMIMWLSILPPLVLTLLNESLNTSPEKQSLYRIGIVASVPFCITGIYGIIFFIPTLILLSLGMVLKPKLMIRDK